MAEELKELVEALLQDFYGNNLDWREVLDGETLALDATIDGNIGEVSSLTFMDDGVRQLATPKPFNPVRCAWALKSALDTNHA